MSQKADRAEIISRLIEMLGPYNRQGISLGPDTDIAAELNIDSAGVMDFIMEVEDAFDIDIPLNVLSETRTIDDLARVVEERLG
jgi:acyl carrier protein